MSENHEKTITDKSQILQLLTEQCLLQESIDIFINDDTQLFCSRIVDKLPDNIDNNEFAESAASYSPYSYMKQCNSILIEPPVTCNGYVTLNKNDQFLVRFYTGHSSHETRVPFQQTLLADGKPVAVKIGLPEQVSVLHTRQQLRVSALPDSEIKLKVTSPYIGNYKPRLREMSILGLSFCISNQLINKFPIGTKVELTLTIQDDVNLVAQGTTCHCTPVSTMECCVNKPECDTEFGESKAVCGIDFDNIDHPRELQVNEIVYFIQREKLIKDKQDLINFNQELESQVEEKTHQLREKDIQLLENDRAVSFATLATGVANEIHNPIDNLKSLIAYVEKSMSKVVDIAKYWDDKSLPEPLNSNFKEFLSQTNFSYLTGTLDEKFVNIKTWIEKIVTIINNLENFSKCDKKTIGKIDISKSIENVIKFLSADENVEFACELQKVPPIECFPNDINQSLLQVIKNAVEALDNNGIIRISSLYEEENDQIVVKIIDNGNGMSPDVLEQVFKPFFTTKPVGTGTGMGLPIIEKIIKRHKGTINISSRKDLGTTVTITLPVKNK